MKPRIREGITIRAIGHERMLHDDASEHIHVLDERAAVLCDLMDGTRNLAALEADLMARYLETPPASLRQECRDALMTLKEKGLIDPPEFTVEKALLIRQHAEAPGDPSPCIHLGNACLRESRYEEARTWLHKALEIEADCIGALINLATLDVLQGRYESAETCLQQALSLDPRHHEALNNMGNLRSRRGEEAEAEALYQQALAAHPDYPDALNNLAHLHAANGREHEAIQFYRKTLAIDPGNGSAVPALLKILLRQEALDSAADVLQEALQADPGNLRYHDTLVGLYRKMGRMEEADAAYRAAIAACPQPNLFVYRHLGAMRSRAGG